MCEATTCEAEATDTLVMTYVGIIWQLAGDDAIKKQHIAIDGSVYEKMPLAKENIMRALSELLGESAPLVDTVLENGGSGLGAAIAPLLSQPESARLWFPLDAAGVTVIRTLSELPPLLASRASASPAMRSRRATMRSLPNSAAASSVSPRCSALRSSSA